MKSLPRISLLSLGALLSLTACPTPSTPDAEALDLVQSDPVVRDTARRDVDVSLDGGDNMDASTDATVTPSEASVSDVAPAMDTITPADVVNADGSSSPDVGGTGADGAGFEEVAVGRPYCEMVSALRVCTMDSECDRPIERCLPTGCGAVRRCQPAGRSCRDNADCLAGAQTCTRGVCVASGADCGDSRGCPMGYACEGAAGARACVSRRRACDPVMAPCPYGGVCEGVAGIDPFCVAVTSRCASDVACRRGSTCRDVDGDGLNECVPGGPCSMSRCAAGERCEILPVEYFLQCGPRGICNPAAGCAAGYECVDVWASGVFECRPTAEPCRSNATCPMNQLCYEAGGGGMPGAAAGCR